MGAKLVIAALAILLVAAPARPARAGSSESELKAEFIERFTRFVDWDVLPKTDFTVCVVGDSDLTPHLQALVKKRKIKDRKGIVKVLDKPDKIGDCQLVVIGGNDKKRLAAVLSRTDGKPILTIADAPGAGAAGAIVNFYRDGKHVKFEINTGAAADAGLEVRSKLLKLARLVKGSGS